MATKKGRNQTKKDCWLLLEIINMIFLKNQHISHFNWKLTPWTIKIDDWEIQNRQLIQVLHKGNYYKQGESVYKWNLTSVVQLELFWRGNHPLNSHRTFLSIGETDFRSRQDIKINHNHCSQGSYRLVSGYLTCIHDYTREWYIIHFVRNGEGMEWKKEFKCIRGHY